MLPYYKNPSLINPLIGKGIKIIFIGWIARDMGRGLESIPQFEIIPKNTCPICLGIGGCGYLESNNPKYRHWTKCWYCNDR